jgi:hypothetical protein
MQIERGFASGVPAATWWPPPTSSMPLSCGSIAGNLSSCIQYPSNSRLFGRVLKLRNPPIQPDFTPGNNPAIIQVGASYTDLGAQITGPQSDFDLGITTYVNGTPMNPVQLDTIDYVATDSQGLTSTSTRTVIIQAANDNQASTTPTNDNVSPLTATTTAPTL